VQELAANFSSRAEAVREMYLSLLWNPRCLHNSLFELITFIIPRWCCYIVMSKSASLRDRLDFFSVWKDGTQAKAGN
jgi:hypothetical protein